MGGAVSFYACSICAVQSSNTVGVPINLSNSKLADRSIWQLSIKIEMDRRVYSATLALFLTLGTICAATPLSWENIPPISSSVLRSRWYAGSVVYNNGLYVFGGEGSPSGVNDTGILGEFFLYVA